jgi:acylphosphatase
MSAETGGGTIRCHIIYSGRVQGVCFRANAQELSRRRRVAGFVRNLPDGTVELEAEGARAVVDAFLAAIAEHFTGYITHAQQTTLPPRGDETRFEVRY